MELCVCVTYTLSVVGSGDVEVVYKACVDEVGSTLSNEIW